MDTKTKILLAIGAVCAGVTGAILASSFAPEVSRWWWTTAALGTCSFTFFAFAFGTVQWALVSVPVAFLGMAGLLYFGLHQHEPSGLVVLLLTIVVETVIAWGRLRASRPHADA